MTEWAIITMLRNLGGTIWGALAAFFGGWPLRAWVGLVLAASVAFWWSGQRGYDRGVADMQAREARIESKAHGAGVMFQGQIFALNDAIKIDLADRYHAIDFTFDTMQSEVIHYVTPEIDRRYPVSCGFVRVHDASILGIAPARLVAAGCQRDDAPAPTTASAVSRSNIERGRYEEKLRAQNAALIATINGYIVEYDAWRAKLKSIKDDE